MSVGRTAPSAMASTTPATTATAAIAQLVNPGTRSPPVGTATARNAARPPAATKAPAHSVQLSRLWNQKAEYGHEERKLEGQDGLHDGEPADMKRQRLKQEPGDEHEPTEQPHLAVHGVGDELEAQRVGWRGRPRPPCAAGSCTGRSQRPLPRPRRKPRRYLPKVGSRCHTTC